MKQFKSFGFHGVSQHHGGTATDPGSTMHQNIALGHLPFDELIALREVLLDVLLRVVLDGDDFVGHSGWRHHF